MVIHAVCLFRVGETQEQIDAVKDVVQKAQSIAALTPILVKTTHVEDSGFE